MTRNAYSVSQKVKTVYAYLYVRDPYIFFLFIIISINNILFLNKVQVFKSI